MSSPEDLDSTFAVSLLSGSGQPFAHVPPNMLAVMTEAMTEMHVSAGEYLIRQNTRAECLYLINSGEVEVYVDGVDGRESHLGVLSRGDFVGEMALVTEETRLANVVAKTDCHIWKLPAETFYDMLKTMPQMASVLTCIVAERLGSDEFDALSGKHFHDYVVHRRLGRGGMSIVYEALPARGGDRVALKMMSHRLIHDPDAHELFRNEGRVVRSFQHPNIPRIYDEFSSFGTMFIAMEFIDGMTLSDVIRCRGSVPRDMVMPIVGQIAEGLLYAHEHGVVHRDLKPANIMLTNEGVVKIMDFGLAQPPKDKMAFMANLIVGSPRYMAPEQFKTPKVSPAADYFSLACMICEMISGQKLVQGDSMNMILSWHENTAPRRVEETGIEMDPLLMQAINSALQREPQQRHVDLRMLANFAQPIDPSLIH